MSETKPEDNERSKEEKPRFSKKRATREVVIEDEDGTEKNYLLIEMAGGVRDRWMKEMSNRMKTDSSGKPIGVRDFEGLQASLIALCLFFAENRNPVGKDEINKWPSSTQSGLFEICQDMNALTDKAADTAKNN